MSFPICEVTTSTFPPLLREIPDPPKTLNYRGKLPSPDMKLLAVVGSRKYTTYGSNVVDHLVAGLSGHNIGIVSGLALGIDSLAHKAALHHNLYTLAVPGSGIDDDVIYPASHKTLAQEILEKGGGLLSEFAPNFTATRWSFTQRNRIMAGLSHATLLIEAAEKSGTLITARLASEYNRDLLVVPGDIFSSNSAGIHQFLKLGATPVTCAEDILYALGIEFEVPAQKSVASALALSEEEQKVLDTLHEPIDKDTLIRACGIATNNANALLVQMENKGLIKETDNIYTKT